MHIAYGFRIVFEHGETIMIHAGEPGQLFQRHSFFKPQVL